MSAVAMFAGDNGVVIAADGVAYNCEGVVQAFASKIVHLQHLNCVMASVGSGDIHLHLQDAMGMKYADFDDLLAGVGDDMRRIAESPQWQLRKAFGWPVNSTVGLAGWSPARQQFEIYKVSNWDKEIETLDRMKFGSSAAFELIKLDGFWSNCFPPVEFVQEHYVGRVVTNAVNYAARWVCGCRLSSRVETDDQDSFGCGGFLQVAVLNKDAYTSEIMHRWPDEIGKPVDPTIGELMPGWLAVSQELKEVA